MIRRINAWQEKQVIKKRRGTWSKISLWNSFRPWSGFRLCSRLMLFGTSEPFPAAILIQIEFDPGSFLIVFRRGVLSAASLKYMEIVGAQYIWCFGIASSISLNGKNRIEVKRQSKVESNEGFSRSPWEHEGFWSLTLLIQALFLIQTSQTPTSQHHSHDSIKYQQGDQKRLIRSRESSSNPKPWSIRNNRIISKKILADPEESQEVLESKAFVQETERISTKTGCPKQTEKARI